MANASASIASTMVIDLNSEPVSDSEDGPVINVAPRHEGIDLNSEAVESDEELAELMGEGDNEQLEVDDDMPFHWGYDECDSAPTEDEQAHDLSVGGEEHSTEGAAPSTFGANGRKGRTYPNAEKFSIYDELLARTDPPMLHHRVAKEVATMTRRNQKYYMVNDEQRPRRSVKSKNFIEKVMFLTVVTRPRYDSEGNCIFDGKIGIFPFTFIEPAKRSSRNRPRGTLVTKAMTSVRKEHYRDFLVNKVIPAIKAKWPAEEKGMSIFIQQDNAKTHIDVNDPAFVEAAQADGFVSQRNTEQY